MAAPIVPFRLSSILPCFIGGVNSIISEWKTNGMKWVRFSEWRRSISSSFYLNTNQRTSDARVNLLRYDTAAALAIAVDKALSRTSYDGLLRPNGTNGTSFAKDVINALQVSAST